MLSYTFEVTGLNVYYYIMLCTKKKERKWRAKIEKFQKIYIYKAYALDKNGLKGSFWINRWDENANMKFLR